MFICLIDNLRWLQWSLVRFPYFEWVHRNSLKKKHTQHKGICRNLLWFDISLKIPFVWNGNLSQKNVVDIRWQLVLWLYLTKKASMFVYMMQRNYATGLREASPILNATWNVHSDVIRLSGVYSNSSDAHTESSSDSWK